jgi:hypothetical protein
LNQLIHKNIRDVYEIETRKTAQQSTAAAQKYIFCFPNGCR